MGTKDVAEKLLEDYNDVFSDIVNVLLFDGRRVVGEDELADTAAVSSYKADGLLHGQERDVAKYWGKGEIRIAMVGFENQTEPDKDMPLRVISYDGAAYRDQMNHGAQRYPVVTMVLYFGSTPWDKYRSIYECMDIPEDIRPFVNDYRINLFEIARLTDEQLGMFQSDFRIVADYFVQLFRNRDYRPSEQTIRHVQEVLDLMTVLTGDERYGQTQGMAEGGVKNMCEVLDRIEKRGIAEGRMEGRREGRETGRIEGAVLTLADLGYSPEQISGMKNLPLDTVRDILAGR